MKRVPAALRAFLGVESAPASHAEKLVSGAGGALAIGTLYGLSYGLLGAFGAAILVASMGASAVLLFAVPHGPLSQPWPLLGGHLVSAAIGVTCARYVPQPALAAALAVGLAISAMYYLRCIHPPGGATALTAVIGGDAVHALGYQFIVTPVLLNVLAIFVIAVAFNYPFRWRRYPAAWRVKSPAPAPAHEQPLSHEDFVYALARIDSFVDISEDELQQIYHLAIAHANETHLAARQIQLGHFYSNAEYGDTWAVRQIVDESPNPDPAKDLVVYKVVAGNGRRGSGYMTRQTFSQWARCELVRDENNWRRVE